MNHKHSFTVQVVHTVESQKQMKLHILHVLLDIHFVSPDKKLQYP